MEIITKYKVAGREFVNKQEALEYEENLRGDLPGRAMNIVIYYWETYSYPAHSVAVKLLNHFCGNKKIQTKSGNCWYMGEYLLSSDQGSRWSKNISKSQLTDREKLILVANREYHRDPVNAVMKSGYNMNIIHWEIDEMTSDAIRIN